MEPSLLALSDMASFSDAHEELEIPIIAANLHRCMLPSQSQIWAVLREDDNFQRIAYSLVNTFLGVMCISGDIYDLNQSQWDLIQQGIVRYSEDASQALVIIHSFSIKESTTIEIPLFHHYDLCTFFGFRDRNVDLSKKACKMTCDLSTEAFAFKLIRRLQ